MSQKKQVTFEECMENVQTYIKRPENIELIQKAYDFAYEHHKGQFRKSGEPYVIHVIQVAIVGLKILQKITMDVYPPLIRKKKFTIL